MMMKRRSEEEVNYRVMCRGPVIQKGEKYTMEV